MGSSKSKTKEPTEEKLGRLVGVTNLGEGTKAAIFALALAGIERLGKGSAASQIATNTFLLHDIADLLRSLVSKVFVCGGNGQKSVEVYDVSENAWHDAPEMPVPSQEHGIARIDTNRIFIFGGAPFTGGTAQNKAFVFDLEKNEWKAMPPMATPRTRAGVGLIDDKVFVLGGWNDAEAYLDSCEVFEISKNEWKPLPPMPTCRLGMGAATVGHRIFTIGGYRNEGLLDSMEVLDAEDNTWRTLPPMPTARMGMGVIVIDDRFIWTFGGYSGRSHIDQFVDVIEIFDIEKNKWSSCKTVLPSPRSPAATVLVGEKVFLFGGHTSVNDVGQRFVDVLDTKTLVWSSAHPLNASRSWPGVIGI